MKKNILMLAFAVGVSISIAFCLPAFAEKPAGSLPKLAPGQSLGRELNISAIPNLRDVGGYETQDGATVARGLVYRSDTLYPMSSEDMEKLGRLGLKNDYDLRTTAEVKVKPGK